ncbi:MAG: GtrA family protein [Bacilli bacterium]|nr:GtrA family protein [Bacilli bacterium]
MKKEDKLEIIFNKILDVLKIKINNKNRKLLLQIFKFLFVGGLAFLIDYVSLIICKEIFHLSTLLASAIAFTISVIVNYILSVTWVFEVDETKSKKQNFIIFIVFSILGLIITEIIMYLGSDVLKISYLIVKIVATAIVMVFNFVTRKIFLEKK